MHFRNAVPEVGLDGLGSASTSGAGWSRARLTIDRSGPCPRLLLDGQPPAAQAYLRSWEKYPGREYTSFAELCADYRRHYALGCRIFIFQATCASDFYVPDVEVWRGPDEWDFRQLDAYVDFFTRECPEAVIIPLLYVGTPTWWEEANPDELLRFHDGSCEAEFAAASGSPRRRVASLASEAWAAAMDVGLRHVVDRLAAIGPRLSGFMFGGGITYEWGLLGSFGFIDYSAPMRSWWDDWRRRQGLSPAPLPTPEQRMRAEGDWRDPARDADTIALHRCLSDLTAARINRFAATIRRHGGERPIITYYGYTLTAREGQGFVGRYGAGGFQGGHHAFRAVLDCPDVDVITSPWSYADRRLGSGDLSAHYPQDSVRLAGKVSWLQDDNRTCLGFPAQGIDTGFESDVAGGVRQLERATARRMCGADEVYRMDLLGSTWNHPEFAATIARLEAAAAGVEVLRAPPDAEVLVVVDEDAVACLALHSPLHLQNVYRQLPLLARMGCPFHVVLASDAVRLDPTPYKLLILALCPRRDERLEHIVARFRAAGASVLCLPGTGLVGDHGPDPVEASTIAGMPLRLLSRDALTLHGVTPAGSRFGLGRPLSHVCAGAGGMLAGIDGRTEAALALRPRGSAFDAWAAVAPLPADLLAGLAGRAGCHRHHVGGQLVWATPSLIAIHVDRDGAHELRPRGWTGTEAVLAPRLWRWQDGVIVAELAAGETAVFARSAS